MQATEDGSAAGGPALDDYSNLSERTNMFGVSLPGESRWHGEAWGEARVEGEGFHETAVAQAKKPIQGDRGSIGALLKVSVGEIAGPFVFH